MILRQSIFFGLSVFTFIVPSHSDAEVTVIGGLTRENIVTPGQVFEGVIPLRNSGKEAIEAKIYQTDYLFYADGKNFYGEPGKHSRSNAKWIDLSHNFHTIPPGETINIQYLIEVPSDSEMVGTYWSMIMVESSGKPLEPGEREEKEVRIGIKHIMRYGIQMVTHIGDTGAVEIKVMRKELLKEDNNKTLQIDIKNTGERWLRPMVWVELYDEKGTKVGRFDGRKKRIYPGTSIRQDIDVSKVSKGKYKGLIFIDNGDQNVFGSRVKLEI